MKKTILIAALLATLVSLGAVGYVFAQSQNPPATEACPYGDAGHPASGYGHGRMHAGGQRMMSVQGGGDAGGGAKSGGQGLLHSSMVSGFANAFAMTAEDLQARLDAGDTMWVVAQEKGYTAETFTTLMTQVRSDALAQAVAAGDITQEQADWMQERMNQRLENGFTPGNCLHGGGRWNQQP